MICPLPLEEIRRYLTELNMNGFEQFLASLVLAVVPERKPGCDLSRVRHTSLSMARNET